MASTRLGVSSTSHTVWPPGPVDTPSTLTPACVRSDASRRSSTVTSTNSRIHWGRIFTGFEHLPQRHRGTENKTAKEFSVSLCLCGGLCLSCELLQKPHIALEEQLDVIDAPARSEEHTSELQSHS